MSASEGFYRKFGISQGRLTESNELQRFPSEAWQKEFSNASSLGISFIELLDEREFNKDNPIWSKEGRDEIKDIANKNNCEIYSICIDYIINHSLLDDQNGDTLKHVEDIFDAASKLGSSVIIFPLLEESNIDVHNIEAYSKIFTSTCQIKLQVLIY